MSSKTLSVLSGVTLLIILVGVFLGQEKKSTIPKSGELLFPELKAKVNDVAEVTVESKEEQVTLIRSEKSWGVKEKRGYYADMEKVKGAIIGMAELKIREPKTKNPDLYEKLGLKDKDTDGSTSTLVTFKTQDEKAVATLVVGDQRPAKGNPSVSEMYVRQPTDPQTWLVTGKLPLEQLAGEWLDKDVLNLDDKRIRRVHIIHTNGESLSLQKEKPDDLDFQVSDLPKNSKIKSQFSVNNIATTLSKLTLEDIAKEEDVNFAEKSGVKAVVETFDGMQVTVDTTKKDDVTYGKVSAIFDPNLVYQEPEMASSESKEDNESNEEKVKGDAETKKEELTSSENAKESDPSKDQEVETKEPPKPKIKLAEDVQKEVALLNEKLNGWAFVLPKFRVDNFSKRRAELIDKG